MNKIFNFKSKLVLKEQIAETDFKLLYEVPSDFTFKPGQFVGIRVIPTHTRAYSIVGLENNLLELLVDIKPGGIASQYFEKTQVGDEVQLLGPYGIYGIKSDLPNKVFICTGTGVAPFIPMVRSIVPDNATKSLSMLQEPLQGNATKSLSMLQEPLQGNATKSLSMLQEPLQDNATKSLSMLQEPFQGNSRVKMLFGTRTNSNDIAYPYFKKFLDSNFEYFQCVTREEPQMQYSFKGRVTEVLKSLISDKKILPIETEFYICGANNMIADVVEVIKSNGGDKIYFEKYG